MNIDVHPDPVVQERLEASRVARSRTLRNYLRFTIGLRILILLMLGWTLAWAYAPPSGNTEARHRASWRSLVPICGTILYVGVNLVIALRRYRDLPPGGSPASVAGSGS